jgi:hypothetical protein
MVDGATVVDQTGDPEFVPLLVTARLAEPVVSTADLLVGDGPLSWAAYLAARDAHAVLPPLSPGNPPVDFALPVATWTRPAPEGTHPSLLNEAGEVWGWAVSRGDWRPVAWTTAHTRKVPPVKEHARFAQDNRFHAALGPHKARNVPHPAAWADIIQWRLLGRPDPLIELLLRLKGVGRLTRHGWGRIHSVRVEPCAGPRDGWMDRPLPDPAGTVVESARAPHWHPLRRVRCRPC